MERFTSPYISLTYRADTQEWLPTRGQDSALYHKIKHDAGIGPGILTEQKFDRFLDVASRRGYWVETVDPRDYGENPRHTAENRKKKDEEIIREHYGLKRQVTPKEVVAEVASLRRKAAEMSMDSSQERLYAALDLARRYQGGASANPNDPVWDMITSDGDAERNPRGRLKGTVSGVQDEGTIVTVWVDTQGGRTVPVHFDHRPFRHLWEGERGNVVGRAVEVVGSVGEQTLRFLDAGPRLDVGRAERNQPLSTLQKFLLGLVAGLEGGEINWKQMQQQAKAAIQRWAQRQGIQDAAQVERLLGAVILKKVGLGAK
jgi:hypothetical protein